MKYQVIYADPPWTYNVTKGMKKGHGFARDKYSVMSLEDICALPVAEIADKNCYLFLWVTAPMLQEGLKVMEAWGFKYSTVAFTWIKTNKKAGSLFWGMGNTTRSNAEFCLLGRKGTLPRKSAAVHSVLMTPVEEHSKKPGGVRDRIQKLLGPTKRIELFAREKSRGWHVWGDQVQSNINLISKP